MLCGWGGQGSHGDQHGLQSGVAFWPGPRLPKTQLVLAINWKGMYFLDQKERTLLGLSFAEVMGLVANR